MTAGDYRDTAVYQRGYQAAVKALAGARPTPSTRHTLRADVDDGTAWTHEWPCPYCSHGNQK